MSEQNQNARERARTQTETNAAVAGHKVGIEHQSEQINSRKHNPDFYEKFVESSLKDSAKWGDLAEEFAPWLADDHVLANRRQVYRLERQILNKVRAQQSIVGANPGVRLKEKPLLNALAQGEHPELDEPIPLDAAGQSAAMNEINVNITEPMDAAEKTAMDDLAAIVTARQSMGVEQAGSEALTTATTETRTVREDEAEESGTIGSISGVFD